MPSTDVLLIPDYGDGVYRRRIRLASEPGRVCGELQDDFHHFAVDLWHDDRSVTAVRGGGLRMPWTSCGGALPVVERLRGLALGASGRAAAGHTDPRMQCTHLFDLAALAVAHAVRAPGQVRQYDISIPDRRSGATRATLDRDGELHLAWDLEANRIASPEPFAGRSIADRDFGAFAEAQGDDLAEAILVLRRAVFISIGRRYDFERMKHASEFAAVVGGACHTFSSEKLDDAHRCVGSRRDFGADESAIFSDGFSEPFRAFERDACG